MRLIKCKKCGCKFYKKECPKSDTDNISYYWMFCPKCGLNGLMRYYDESKLDDEFEYIEKED